MISLKQERRHPPEASEIVSRRVDLEKRLTASYLQEEDSGKRQEIIKIVKALGPRVTLK